MIGRSAYLRAAISKPWHTYITALLTFSPVLALGVFFAVGCWLRKLRAVIAWRALNIDIDKYTDVLVLSSWPLSYLLGLTLVGCLGGGFQLRFLTPILPACAVLSAAVVVRFTSQPKTVHIPAICSLLLSWSALHCLYFGVLFAPLFADLDFSVFGILADILSSQYYHPTSKEEMISTFKFMAHFGLKRNIQ